MVDAHQPEKIKPVALKKKKKERYAQGGFLSRRSLINLKP